MKKFILIVSLLFILTPSLHSQWDTLKGFVGGNFQTIIKVDSTIFSGTFSILMKSTDEGKSWQDAGLPYVIYIIEYFDNRIFVGTSGGIYISTNVGANWIKTKDNNWTYCFEKSGSYIFAGSYSSGVLVSTNSGSNWTQTSFQTYTVMSITILNNCVFAASNWGLYKSDNWGLTWSQISSIISPYKIHSYGSSIFAFLANSGGTSVVYKSTNLGLNWIQLPGIPNHINTIKQINNQFFISTSNNGVFVTEGLDLPWTQTSLYYSTAFIDGYQNLAVQDSSIYVGTNNDGIYYSHNLGVNWTNAGTAVMPYFYGAACQNDTVFAYSDGNILYRSTNNGSNFTKFKHFVNQNYSDISIYDRILYLFGGNGLTMSSDGGINWTKTSTLQVTCLFKNGNKLYQASNNAGLWISTNSGLNWSLLWNNNSAISSVIAYDSTIIVTNTNIGIFLSTNNGSNWQQTKTLSGLYGLQKTDSAIFCGHSLGVLKSTNGGFNWLYSGLDSVPVLDFKFRNNYLYAATNVGVFMSSNYGVNWVQKNQNLGPKDIQSLDMSYNYIYASPRWYYGFLWRRLISDITSVKLINNETPKSFSLEQNYPNPFNPETTVKFNIPKSSFVTIKIYDILGKELQTLVQKQLTPGTYQLNFNASDYPSGVYFYRLTALDNSSNVTFTETKRLVYMK